MSKEPSAAIMESLMATFANYYRQGLTAKIKRSMEMNECQTAVQLLEAINAAIEEWFESEIRAHESKIDEE